MGTLFTICGLSTIWTRSISMCFTQPDLVCGCKWPVMLPASQKETFGLVGRPVHKRQHLVRCVFVQGLPLVASGPSTTVLMDLLISHVRITSLLVWINVQVRTRFLVPHAMSLLTMFSSKLFEVCTTFIESKFLGQRKIVSPESNSSYQAYMKPTCTLNCK